MSETTERQIDQLLHDAEHADAGVGMADMLRNPEMAKQLRSKRDRLIAEAIALDPQRTCSAWKETNIPAALLRSSPPEGPIE